MGHSRAVWEEGAGLTPCSLPRGAPRHQHRYYGRQHHHHFFSLFVAVACFSKAHCTELQVPRGHSGLSVGPAWQHGARLRHCTLPAQNAVCLQPGTACEAAALRHTSARHHPQGTFRGPSLHPQVWVEARGARCPADRGSPQPCSLKGHSRGMLREQNPCHEHLLGRKLLQVNAAPKSSLGRAAH